MAPEQVEALNGYIRGENEEFTSIGLKRTCTAGSSSITGPATGLTIESQEDAEPRSALKFRLRPQSLIKRRKKIMYKNTGG